MSIDWTIQWTLTNNTGSTITGRRDYKDRMSEAEGSGPWTLPCTDASGHDPVAVTLPSDDDYCPSVGPRSTKSIAWKYSIDVDKADTLKTQMVRGYVEFSDTGGNSDNSFQVHWYFHTGRRTLIFEVAPFKDNHAWTCGLLKAGINLVVNDAAHPSAAAPNSDVNVDHQDSAAEQRTKLHDVAEAEAVTWGPLVAKAQELDGAHKTWSPKNRDDQDDVGQNVDARDALVKKYFQVIVAGAQRDELSNLQTNHPFNPAPPNPSPGRDWCGIFAYWVISQIRSAQQWSTLNGAPVPAGVDVKIQPTNGKAGGYTGYEILRPGDILYFSTPDNNNHFVMVTKNWGDGTVDYVQGNATASLLAGGRVPLTFTGLTKVTRGSPKSHLNRPLQIVRCGVPAPDCASGCKLSSQPACPSGYGPEMFNRTVVVNI